MWTPGQNTTPHQEPNSDNKTPEEILLAKTTKENQELRDLNTHMEETALAQEAKITELHNSINALKQALRICL